MLIDSQVPNIPTVEPVRWKYLVRKTRQLLVNLLVLDAIHTYKFLDPVASVDIDKVVPFTAQPYTRRALLSLLAGAQVYHSLSLQYNVVAFVVVALGIQEAQLWPDFFGSFRDAYTIRKFWA